MTCSVAELAVPGDQKLAAICTALAPDAAPFLVPATPASCFGTHSSWKPVLQADSLVHMQCMTI